MNFGRSSSGEIFAAVQYLSPFPSLRTKGRKGNSAVTVRKASQLDEPGGEQRSSAAQIVAAVMMECRSQLNQPLQESLLGLGFDQPQLFPYLVRLEKPARVKQGNTFSELFAFFHRARTRFRIEFLGSGFAIIAARERPHDDSMFYQDVICVHLY
jgi:hypothetical protein